MASQKQRANAEFARIRREHPHQVALPAEMCCMENYVTLQAYFSTRGLPFVTTYLDAVWPGGATVPHRLFCFAEPQDAAAFATYFEGIPFDPAKDREDGRLHGVWRRTDRTPLPTQYGPLKVPRFFRENP